MIYKKQQYRITIIFLLCLSFVLTSPTFSQKELKGPSRWLGGPVSYSVQAPDTVCAGAQFKISVIFNIQEGWHVYAPLDFNEEMCYPPVTEKVNIIIDLK